MPLKTVSKANAPKHDVVTYQFPGVESSWESPDWGLAGLSQGTSSGPATGLAGANIYHTQYLFPCLPRKLRKSSTH